MKPCENCSVVPDYNLSRHKIIFCNECRKEENQFVKEMDAIHKDLVFSDIDVAHGWNENITEDDVINKDSPSLDMVDIQENFKKFTKNHYDVKEVTKDVAEACGLSAYNCIHCDDVFFTKLILKLDKEKSCPKCALKRRPWVTPLKHSQKIVQKHSRCDHVWRNYYGLIENYRYCEKCDEKDK